MKSKLGDKQRLQHIRDACQNILTAIEGYTLDSFIENFIVENAVCNLLIIVGEASNSISNEFKAEHLEFNWNVMKGMRNIIVHEYFGINFEIVFQTAQNDIPVLLENTHKVLKDLE